MRMQTGARYFIMTATHYFDGILMEEDDDSYMLEGKAQVFSIGKMENLGNQQWAESEDYPERKKGAGRELFRPQIAKGGIIAIFQIKEPAITKAE